MQAAPSVPPRAQQPANEVPSTALRCYRTLHSREAQVDSSITSRLNTRQDAGEVLSRDAGDMDHFLEAAQDALDTEEDAEDFLAAAAAAADSARRSSNFRFYGQPEPAERMEFFNEQILEEDEPHDGSSDDDVVDCVSLDRIPESRLVQQDTVTGDMDTLDDSDVTDTEVAEIMELPEQNVKPSSLPELTELSEDDDVEVEASLMNASSNRLAGRRVAGSMSPVAENAMELPDIDPVGTFRESRIGAGKRRHAGTISPPLQEEEQGFNVIIDAANLAANAGDVEMGHFLMAAAAAAAELGGYTKNDVFDNFAENHVDDEFVQSIERSSRLGNRTVAAADDERTRSHLSARQNAETLRVSALQRRNVDSGATPEPLVLNDLSEAIAQQIASGTPEMIELAQQIVETTLTQKSESDSPARSSPRSPMSPRSPRAANARRRSSTNGQENAYTTITSPKSARKSFDTQNQQAVDNLRRMSDSSRTSTDMTMLTESGGRRRKNSMDPTGGLTLPLSPTEDLRPALLNDIMI